MFFSLCICELRSYACLRAHSNGGPHMRKRMNRKMALARAARGARGSSCPMTYDSGSGASGHSSHRGGVVRRSRDVQLTRPLVVTIRDDSPVSESASMTAKEGILWHHPTERCKEEQPARTSARVDQMEIDKEKAEPVRKIPMSLLSSTDSSSITPPLDGSDDRSIDFKGM